MTASRPAMNRNTTSASVQRSRRSEWLVASLALVVTLTAVLLGLMMVGDRERAVLAPLVTEIAVVLGFLLVLWHRDRQLPIFDVGAVCLLATLAYAVFPLIGFCVSGFSFGLLSDSRLVTRDPSAEEVGAFAWRYVLHMIALASAYLWIRREGIAYRAPVCSPPRSMLYPLGMGVALLLAYFAALQAITGFSVSVPYEVRRGGEAVELESLPLLVQQITHNANGILFVFKLAILVLLFQRYRSGLWRVALYGWLASEMLLTTVRLGSRGSMVLLLVAAVLLYHRMVHPLTLVRASVVGVLALGLFLVMGFARDYAADTPGYMSLLMASNEFQALFGTAYDVYMMRSVENVDIPWQLHLADFFRVIPQQILPFEKIDPWVWYLEQLGGQETKAGLMFGTISEGLIAWDWVSIAAQGILIGAMLAAAHRWYAPRCGSFLGTVAYLWLCVQTYYTFRGSSLYVLTWVVYRLLPALFFLRVASTVIRVAADTPGKPRKSSLHGLS